MTLSREAKDFAHMNAPALRMGASSYYRHVQDTIQNRGCVHSQFDAAAPPLTRPAPYGGREQPLASPARDLSPREAASISAPVRKAAVCILPTVGTEQTAATIQARMS
jgi:hypothetical protein